MGANADASARGKSNRNKGADTERKLANWMLPWFPEAERAEKNGWRTAYRSSADPGDIDKTSPGLFWSAKYVQVEAIAKWMAEMDDKGAGRLGLLVVRRKGHASPGEWWCWFRLHQLLELCDGLGPAFETADAPVRMELQHVMPLLVRANYAREPVAA
jgi:hypothetical protein